MSKILRRPMFRGGGTVSSYGNGIASGLGYADGGQIGGGVIHGEKMGNRYGFAEPEIDAKEVKKNEIIQQVMIEFPNATIEEQMAIAGERLGNEESFLDNSGIGSILKTVGNLGLDATSSIMDTAINVPINTVGRFFGYNPGLSANKNVEEIKTSIFGDNAEIYNASDPDRDEDANPDVAEFFGINTNAENTGAKREREAKEYLEIAKEKQLKEQIAAQKEAALANQNKKIEQMYSEKSDTDVMKEYMDMFSEAYGTDPEDLKRSRYLELAKFGANILAQPGGQSLGETLGIAGGPALEGLSKIEQTENEGQRQLKGIALQAAMKKMDNPYLEKITTMSKLTGNPGDAGYKSPADIINLEFVNASDGRNALMIKEMNMKELENQSVESPLAASEQLQNANIQISETVVVKNFNENTGDLVEDQIYIAQKPSGKNYVAKWDGRKFIFPGDEGF